MNLCLSIAAHEWRRYFSSPLAWVCLAAAQLILGVVFWLLLAEFSATADGITGVTEFLGGGLLGFATIILLMMIPLLSMRSFAEERQSGSLELLLASPASIPAIVLGKYLGLLSLLGVMLLFIALMPLSLLLGSNLDLGLLASGTLGLGLMMAAFAAAALFMSSLSAQPVVAAFGGFALLLLLWLAQATHLDGVVGEIIQYLSLLSHFDNLRRGVFDSADVLFYVLFSAFFLNLCIQRLTWERQA